jgi:uncharacterized RDD family membrane protein YckC
MKKTTTIWVSGAAAQAASFPLLASGPDVQELTGLVLFLAGSVALVIGTRALARAHGLSGWLGLIGVLNILGVLPFLLAEPSPPVLDPTAVPESPSYAGFWIRMLAFLIDGLVMAPFVYIGIKAVQQANIFQYFVSFLSLPLYKPLMEAKQGGTIGKQICKIRVQDANGENLSVKAAYVRFYPLLLHSVLSLLMCYMLFNNPFFTGNVTPEHRSWVMRQNPFYWLKQAAALFAVADILFIFVFRRRKRTLHDLMARSFCVKINIRATASTATNEPAAGGSI